MCLVCGELGCGQLLSSVVDGLLEGSQVVENVGAASQVWSLTHYLEGLIIVELVETEVHKLFGVT